MDNMTKVTLDEFIEKSIKPCPFCGNRPRISCMSMDLTGVATLEMECCMRFYIDSDDLVRIDTFAEGTQYKQIGMNAIEKWNRRANE